MQDGTISNHPARQQDLDKILRIPSIFTLG